MRALDHFVGEKRGSAAESGKEHLAPRTLVTRSRAGEIRTGKAIRSRVVGKMLRFRIEAGNAIVGTHPERAMAVLEDAAYDGTGNAIPLVVALESAGCRIELVKAILSSSPEGA